MHRELGEILLMVLAGAVVFAACSSPEDPVGGSGPGCTNCSCGVVECAAKSCSTSVSCTACSTSCGTSCSTSTSCGTSTTTCSTSGITTTPKLTTTLDCASQIDTGVCQVGATIACFDGPPDALVAPCAAGISTCATDTSGYDAACVGEIIPHPDACDFAGAWSCDASPSECGPGLFAQAFGGSGNESATSVALDAAGNVVIAGEATATDLQFGAVAIHLGASGGFIAKLDASHTPIWAVGAEGAEGTVVAVDPAGSIYAVGMFDTSLEVGGQTLTGSADRSVFALKLSPAGDVVWLSKLEKVDAVTVNAVALAPSGDVLVAGSYAGHDPSIAGVTLPQSSDTSGVVFALEPLHGATRWAQSVRVTGDLALRSITSDSLGNIYVAGAMIDPGACEEHPLIGGLTSGGSVSWLRELSFSGVALAIANDADAGAVVTGTVRATIKLDGVVTRADGFVSAITPTGPRRWIRALPDWEGHAVGVDDSGAIVVAGAAPANGSQPPSGRAQKSDDDGHRFYDLSFVPTPVGTAPSLTVDGLAIAPGVGVVLVGGLRGSATFGVGASPPTATSTARLDPWVAALGP